MPSRPGCSRHLEDAIFRFQIHWFKCLLLMRTALHSVMVMQFVGSIAKALKYTENLHLKEFKPISEESRHGFLVFTGFEVGYSGSIFYFKNSDNPIYLNLNLTREFILSDVNS